MDRGLHALGPAGEVVLMAQLAFIGAQSDIRARRDFLRRLAGGEAFFASADARGGFHLGNSNRAEGDRPERALPRS